MISRNRLFFTSLMGAYLAYKYVNHENDKTLSQSNPSFTPLSISEKTKLSASLYLIRVTVANSQKFPTDTSFYFHLAEPQANSFRPFTPVNWSTIGSYVEFFVRKYPPPMGEVARHLCALEPGEQVFVHGPHSEISLSVISKYSKVQMVVGGTGIAPILQTLKLLIDRGDDLPEITVFYGSRSSDEIIFRDQLKELERKSNNKLNVKYFIDSKPKNMDEIEGRISVDDISAPSDEMLTIVSGPPSMMETICGPKINEVDQGPIGGYLKEKGYKSENVYKF